MLLCCPLISHKAAHSCLSGKSWERVGFPPLTPCFYQFLQRAESSCCRLAAPSRAVCLPVGSSLGRMFQQGAAPCFILLSGRACWIQPLVPPSRPLRSGGVTSLDSFLLLSL